MLKDKTFVCQRCQVRLLKASPKVEVHFKWTEESFKELKLESMRDFGRKPKAKVILTSCLGLCPDRAVAYQESKASELLEEKSYAPELSKEDLKEKFFKP